MPGRSSQALQAIGVDGRRVSELVVELWVKARDVVAGPTDDEHGATVLVSFFDENRVPVGQQTLGPWTRHVRLAAPQRAARRFRPTARVAIVAVGLLGATGELSCDQLAIRMANARSAKR